jgi:peptidylprolyl isomerase
MKRPLPLALFILLLPSISAGQGGDPSGSGASRVEKIRAILRAQDLRAGADTLFRRCLSDPDTAVRERATLACASLQDTSLIPDLVRNLVEGPASVQEAAAFAIGQTAASLSREEAGDLAREIVAGPLDRTSARDRLIGELGKFGTERELNELVIRARKEDAVGRVPYLVSLARFAIRSITTSEGTSFAAGCLVDSPGSGWWAAYALQRMGDNPTMRAEAARLARVAGHPDPLVRMNLAALFGKLKHDSTLVAPLLRLSGGDADWRVRVNALKALGNHPPDHRIAAALGGAMRDEDESISLTGLGVVAGYGPGGPGPRGVPGPIEYLLPALRRAASGGDSGKNWRWRAGAATALAKLEGGASLPALTVPAGAEPLLAAGLIAAAGATGAPEAMGVIAPFLAGTDPLYRRTALEAVQSLVARNPSDGRLRDSAYAASVEALGSGDMAVVTTAAANLGDSLLLRRESVPALSAALGTLRPPADIEAIQEVCRTLAKIGDTSAAPALRAVAASGDPPAALAAATALKSLTGEAPPSTGDPGAVPLRTDFDFGYLESLPETIAVRLRTGKGDVLMEWYRDAAPFTIMHMLKLAEGKGFYRNMIFHRVVPNFVVQGGDPRGDGWGGPGYSVRSEFSPLSYETGTVGIASAGKDTEGSQFFVTHSPQPHLDGRYTIIGRVVAGMDVVDRIQVGDTILDVERTNR